MDNKMDYMKDDIKTENKEFTAAAEKKSKETENKHGEDSAEKQAKNIFSYIFAGISGKGKLNTWSEDEPKPEDNLKRTLFFTLMVMLMTVLTVCCASPRLTELGEVAAHADSGALAEFTGLPGLPDLNGALQELERSLGVSPFSSSVHVAMGGLLQLLFFAPLLKLRTSIYQAAVAERKAELPGMSCLLVLSIVVALFQTFLTVYLLSVESLAADAAVFTLLPVAFFIFFWQLERRLELQTGMNFSENMHKAATVLLCLNSAVAVVAGLSFLYTGESFPWFYSLLLPLVIAFPRVLFFGTAFLTAAAVDKSNSYGILLQKEGALERCGGLSCALINTENILLEEGFELKEIKTFYGEERLNEAWKELENSELRNKKFKDKDSEKTEKRFSNRDSEKFEEKFSNKDSEKSEEKFSNKDADKAGKVFSPLERKFLFTAAAIIKRGKEAELSLCESAILAAAGCGDFPEVKRFRKQDDCYAARCFHENIRLGGREYVGSWVEADPETDKEVQELQERAEKRGEFLLYMSMNRRLCAVFVFGRKVAADAENFVKSLQENAYKVMLLVERDNKQAAFYSKNLVGAENVMEGLEQGEKAALLGTFRLAGHKTAFLTASAEDGTAMETADFSVIPGSASDGLWQRADAILLDNSTDRLMELFLTGASLGKSVRKLWYVTLGGDILLLFIASGILSLWEIPCSISFLLLLLSFIFLIYTDFLAQKI